MSFIKKEKLILLGLKTKCSFQTAIIFVCFILIPVSSFSFECRPKGQPNWVTLNDGVSWAKYDLDYTPYIKERGSWEPGMSRTVTVRAVKINLTQNKLRFLSPDTNISCDPSSELYITNVVKESGVDVIAAINASFFIMPAGKILGMALDEERIWSDDIASQTISSSGIFGILNGNYFMESKDNFIKQYGDTIGPADAAKFTFAVQAYPRLLKDSELQIGDWVLNSRRSRTSIGVDAGSEEPRFLLVEL